MKRASEKKSKRIFHKVLLIALGFVLLYSLCVILACIPGLLLLPEEKTITIDGITTLEDAARSCAESGHTGWELVEYAQK